MKMNKHRWIYSKDIMNAFWELGFEDITSGNDLCDSIGLDLGNGEKWDNYFQIYLANSLRMDGDNEQWNTSILYYYEEGILVSDTPIETDDIMELLSVFKTFIITTKG
tara:strand:+ start:67 stop:390 length:324 start_codon:yes stop_codon:yes gene_type:complete